MRTLIMIPARLNSSRLPGKLLLDLGGHPVLWHTVQQAKQCQVDRVVLVTDSEEIYTTAEGWGVERCMTGTHHENGTERLAEAVDLLKCKDSDIIVNVQGDEPFIPPANIMRVAENLKQLSDVMVATLAEPFETIEVFLDPSRVKVVRNRRNEALYFSRAPIPWDRAKMPHALPEGALAHIGLYAYRVSFLRRYSSLAPSPLEQLESLEQLRVLWQGEKIHVDIAPQYAPPGIDTQEGLQKARQYLFQLS